jgi:hypothetical protein
MHARSGLKFCLYVLENVSTANVEQAPPIATSASMASLLRPATQREDERFECGGDDADGFELSSRLPSPLTDLEESDDLREDEQDDPAAATYRRKVAAKKCRSLKRITRARSGHAPSSYAANPSVLEKLEDSLVIELGLDVRELPSSSEGSWVGKRSKGQKATPWMLQELEDLGFTLVEWDGWSVFLF